MPAQKIKVEVGQIWIHPTDPRCQYYIHDFRPSPYPDQLDVMTVLIYKRKDNITNKIYGIDFFGRCLLDGTPRWPMDGWTVVPVKKFTPISPKLLKKKIRDQIVQQVLITQDIGTPSGDPSPNGDKT